MNRYRSGGPSKATSITLCQKCLKKGHYTYECSATQQDRPYISRPSRSQQLSNPKLAPKLSSTLPPADAKPVPKAVAKDRSGAVEASAAREKTTKDAIVRDESRRRRSVSSYSSDSVSSFSTNRSRSRSRGPPRVHDTHEHRRNRSLERPRSSHSVRKDRSPDYSRRESETSKAQPRNQRHSRQHTRDRGSRHRSRSPAQRLDDRDDGYRRRSRFRSPYRGAKGNSRPPVSEPRGPPRERSLSPYSQRLALTKGMNG